MARPSSTRRSASTPTGRRSSAARPTSPLRRPRPPRSRRSKMRLVNKTSAAFLGLALLASSLAPAAGAATITIVNADGAGEGFNDPTVVAPVGGNPGTTVGQQRLNVFQYAANIWGALLPSSVTIVVRAQFNPQTCTATSATLGSTSPFTAFANFSGAPFPNHWYHVAEANRL